MVSPAETNMALQAGATLNGFDNAMMPLADKNMFVRSTDTPSLSSSLDFFQLNLPTTRNGLNEASPVHRPLDGLYMATDGSKAESIPFGASTGSLTFRETASCPLPGSQSPPIPGRLGQPMEESFSDVFDYNGIALSRTASLKELFSSIEVESKELLSPLGQSEETPPARLEKVLGKFSTPANVLTLH